MQKFNSRVNRRVQALFGVTGLVPVLEGFKSVSIHRLRALYGAIAVHFFCANNQHLHRFLQNHLGHVLTREVGVGNSRATDHYFHYYLVKEDGSPITARGVKLMAHGALVEMAQGEEEVQTVITAGETGQTAVAIPYGTQAIDQVTREAASVPVGRLRQKVGLLRFPAETRDRWQQVLKAIAPPEASKLEQMMALLEWIEDRIEEPSESQPQPPTDPAAAAPVEEAELMQVKAALEAVLQRLDKLEAERATPNERQGRKPRQAEGGGKATLAPSTRKLGGAVDRANSIFLAVQAWNRLHPDQSFALTLSLLKDEFGINFRAARDFLEGKQNEIWELHQASGVENARSHNRQGGRNMGELKRFVKGFSHPSSPTTAAE